MTRRRLRQLVTIIATLTLAAAAVWLRQEDPGTDRFPPGRPRASVPTPTTAWTELRQPVLADRPSDDGDSFTVRHAGGEAVIRLYFVDCPEKRRNPYNGARLADQGAAFGGLTENETLRLGRDAREFTLSLLRARPFRVVTRWEPVFDDRRHYAHVFITEADGTERLLAERLVEAGLARIHTKGADLPDGTRRARFDHHLRSLEKSARLAGRGGWSRFAEDNAAREE